MEESFMGQLDSARRRIVGDWLHKADTGDAPEPDFEEARIALALAKKVRDAVLPLIPMSS